MLVLLAAVASAGLLSADLPVQVVFKGNPKAKPTERRYADGLARGVQRGRRCPAQAARRPMPELITHTQEDWGDRGQIPAHDNPLLSPDIQSTSSTATPLEAGRTSSRASSTAELK